MMDDALQKLYDGEIYPNEMTELNVPEYHEAEQRYFSARTAFEDGLPEALAKEFEQLKELEADFQYINDYNMFRKGYIIGTQLLIEGMNLKK